VVAVWIDANCLLFPSNIPGILLIVSSRLLDRLPPLHQLRAMDVDYGSHSVHETARKRQRLDYDTIDSATSTFSTPAICQPDSWYHNDDNNNELEDLWAPVLYDSQNNSSAWSNIAPEVTSYSTGTGLSESSYSLSTLPRFDFLSPGEIQQSFDDHVDVEEENVDRSEQEEQDLICFGMVGIQFNLIFLIQNVDTCRFQTCQSRQLSRVY
jgi:hypothetical protein